MKTCIVADPFYAKHLTGIGHPECPQRYDAIVNALERAGLKNEKNFLQPRKAMKDEILLCHGESYYDQVQLDVRKAELLGLKNGQMTLSTGDVQISPESFECALLAAGGVLTAVDAVMQGKFKQAFCVVRPPGHHATMNAGMGFCIFNNVAIGARYVQKKYGIHRVLIVDWDVHHGNGTQDIFEADSSVFYFSTHQWPLYPGTGHPDEVGKGNIMNVPILAGQRSRLDILKAFSERLTEAMQLFKPQFVFISAGFDAHRDDPLGGCNLTNEDFAELTKIMKGVADTYADGRLVSVLEGGYNLEAIAAASVAHVTALG